MAQKFSLQPNDDGTYDIIVEYNRQEAEFALDFLSKENISKGYKTLSEFLSKKAKNIKIKAVRVVLAGAILATIPFASMMKASAAKDDSRYAMAYLYGGSVQQQIEYVNRTNNAFQTVSPSYFDINKDGSLKLNPVSTDLIDAMHENGIKVVPFLSNHWDRTAGINALKDVELLSTQIANYISQYKLDGINVDIENVSEKQRYQYTQLVKLLRQKIPANKEVSVAVAANPNNWQLGWHGSYDYTELANNSDYLMIMTYDEHFEGGEAGPVASIQFVENSIKYALSKTTSDKIVLGLPFFGRIWSQDTTDFIGKGISIEQINRIVNEYGGKITYDKETESPKAEFEVKQGDKEFKVSGKTLTPGKYVVWYENEDSLQKKLELVREHDLKGAGSWALGQEDVSIWNNFNSWLNGDTQEVLPPTGDIVYSVEAGDSLWKIAQKFNTSVDAIKTINRLSGNSLDIGQKIYISVGVINADYTLHEVKPGDTFWKLSQEHGVSVESIKAFNNLKDDTLNIGQFLKIPPKVILPVTPPEAPPPPTPPKPNPAPSPAPEQKTYTVKKGDSLWKIANSNKTTVDALKKLNGLKSDNLSVGQLLKLSSAQTPSASAPAPSYKSYTVKKGDSLWKIANANKSSVEAIKKLNGLKGDNLAVGQQLKIPK